MKLFYALPLLLAASSSLSAATAQQQQQDSNTSVRHLRGIPQARNLISDAILSSVHSDNGNIDPSVLERAVQAGIPADFLVKVSNEAYQKVKEQGVSVQQIEDDMKVLRDQQKAEEEENTNTNNNNNNNNNDEQQQQQQQQYSGYQPTGRWNMSTQAHVALSKAVMSGFRNSPDHTMDPLLLEEAAKEGVSEELIQQSLDTMLKSRQNIIAKREEQESNNNNTNNAMVVLADNNEHNNNMQGLVGATPLDNTTTNNRVVAPTLESLQTAANNNNNILPSVVSTHNDDEQQKAAKTTTPPFRPSSAKDMLSTAGLKKLSHAVLNAFRNDGVLDEELVQNALDEEGVTREQIEVALDKMMSNKNKNAKKLSSPISSSTDTGKVPTNYLRASSSQQQQQQEDDDLLLSLDLLNEIVAETVNSVSSGVESTPTGSSNTVVAVQSVVEEEQPSAVVSSQQQQAVPHYHPQQPQPEFVYADNEEVMDEQRTNVVVSVDDVPNKKEPVVISEKQQLVLQEKQQDDQTQHDELRKHIAFAELSRAVQKQQQQNGVVVDPKIVQNALDAGVPRSQVLSMMQQQQPQKEEEVVAAVPSKVTVVAAPTNIVGTSSSSVEEEEPNDLPADIMDSIVDSALNLVH
mmetsp:Transcript_10884/g.16653  ORF Transcript_10884/g.16653 Transcript_10884/m.16653 type:complete len:632 (+) Transcript_10884:157-2052(+)